jgi:organic hydroperoxide reductase OsmC/OhrA
MVQPYPHRYTANAQVQQGGGVIASSAGLPDIDMAAPREFDGPGDLWSPETLLCASVATCFILTFRAFARAARLDWSELDCRVEGVLDRLEGVAQFAGFTTYVKLTIPSGTDPERARSLITKSEDRCLVTNSLKGTRQLVVDLVQ